MTRIVVNQQARGGAAPAYVEATSGEDRALFTAAEWAAALDRAALNPEDTEPAGAALNQTIAQLILAHRRVHPSGPPPAPGPSTPAPRASVASAVSHATGVITATPTYSPASGQTITSATLGLYTLGGALLEAADAPSSGAAFSFGAQPDGTYLVRLSVTQSDLQTQVVEQQVVLNSTTPAGSVIYSADAELDAKIRMILGPQVTMGDAKMDGTSATTARNPWPWLDSNALASAATLADNFPSEPPAYFGGTGGDGTFSRTAGAWEAGEYVGRNMRFFDGAGGVLGTFPVTANTGTTLSFVGDATGAVSAFPWGEDANSTEAFSESWIAAWYMYYDLGLTLWQTYYRSGDTVWRDRALRVTNCWWRFSWIGAGLASYADQAPRMAAVGGLMLTALYEDATLTGEGAGGVSTKWDGLYRFIQYKFWEQTWNPFHLGNPTLGTRDPGYATLDAARIARILPDSYVCTAAYNANKFGIPEDNPPVGDAVDGVSRRAALRASLADVIGAGGWASSQMATGEWDQFETEFELSGHGGIPFHIGLLLEGQITAVNLLTPYTEYATHIAEAKASILLAIRYLWYMGYQKPVGGMAAVRDQPGKKWRAMVYRTQTSDGYSGAAGGTVALTEGSTTILGTGTTLQTEIDHPCYPIYFRRYYTGTLAFTTASAQVVGSGTAFLSEVVPGALLMADSGNGYYREVQVRSVEDDTHLTLTRAIGTDGYHPEMAGAGRAFAHGQWMALPGNYTVDAATGTITGDATDLAVGDEIWANADDNTFDAWEVTAIHSPTEFVVVGNNPDKAFTAPTLLLRRARKGEEFGRFEVDHAVSETELVLKQPWPAAARSGVEIWIDNYCGVNQGSDSNTLRNARHQSATASHAFGWAFRETGDPVWRDRGDEIMGALWGKDNVGLLADGVYTLADYITPNNNRRGKEFNENMRSSPQYLGYRLLGGG